MGFTVYEAFNETQSLAQANNYPNIRIFKAAPETATTQQTELIQVGMPWSIPNNKFQRSLLVLWNEFI